MAASTAAPTAPRRRASPSSPTGRSPGRGEQLAELLLALGGFLVVARCRAALALDAVPQVVDEAGPQVLLAHARAAADRDVLVARRLLCLRERGLNAVGDEGEGRAALFYEWLA